MNEEQIKQQKIEKIKNIFKAVLPEKEGRGDEYDIGWNACLSLINSKLEIYLKSLE